jgi:D-3-phosphoglycerate dehydrogenase
LALAGDFVPFAVNVSAAEASETVRPFLPLAERLGELFASMSDRTGALDVEYEGQIAEYDTRILTLSLLKGFFGRISDEPVSYVNAPKLAAEQGIEVRELSSTTAHDYVNLITIRGGEHALAGTLVGLKGEPRIVMVDDHTVDAPPANHMVVIRNEDQPGVIGRVATVIGDAGVNISDLHVGTSPSGESALMVLATTEPLSSDVEEKLRQAKGVRSVHTADLG